MAEFESVYRCYRRRVYQWALRYCAGDVDTAEDLVQEAFLKLFHALPNFEGVADLSPWLHRVTANLALYRLRREGRFLRRLARLFAAEEKERAPDETFAVHEEAAAVLALLRQLPARERVVLSMKYLDGKSGREIARELEMSEGYVSKLLARALEQVRAQGWEVDDG